MDTEAPAPLRMRDLGVAVGITLTLTSVWVYQRSGFPMVPSGMDGEEWVRAAEALARGDMATYGGTWRPPGYPWLIAALVPLRIDAHDATILAPMGFAAATVGAAWLIGTAAAGRWSGAVAAWIAACAYGTANTAFSTNSQALFDLLVAAVLGAAIWALGAGAWRAAAPRWALVGLLVGCAAAVKEQGLPILVLGALAAGVGGATCAAGPWWMRAARAVAAAALYGLAAAGPASSLAWAAELQATHGVRGDKLAVMLEDVRALTSAQDWRVATIHNGSWHPPGADAWAAPGLGGLVLWSSLRSAGILLATVGVGALLGVAALPGLRDPAQRRVLLVCLALLLPLAPTFVVSAYPSFHYAFAVVPLAVVAGIGVARVRGRVGRRLALGTALLLPLIPFGDGFEQGGPVAMFRRQMAYYASADFFTLCHELASAAPDTRLVTPVDEMAFLQDFRGPCARVTVAHLPKQIPYGAQIRVYDDRAVSHDLQNALRAAGSRDERCAELVRVDRTPSGRHLRALRCEPAEVR